MIYNFVLCVYCGEPAETWDHVFGLVKNLKYSGYGHVIGNLLPCCKKCNSAKGNKNWLDFLTKKIDDDSLRREKFKIIDNYLQEHLSNELSYSNIEKKCHDEIANYEKIKLQIFDLMKKADIVAASIKNKIKID